MIFFRNFRRIRNDELARIVVKHYDADKSYDKHYLSECLTDYIEDHIKVMEDLLRRMAASNNGVMKKCMLGVMNEMSKELMQVKKYANSKQMFSIRYGIELAKKAKKY